MFEIDKRIVRRFKKKSAFMQPCSGREWLNFVVGLNGDLLAQWVALNQGSKKAPLAVDTSYLPGLRILFFQGVVECFPIVLLCLYAAIGESEVAAKYHVEFFG